MARKTIEKSRVHKLLKGKISLLELLAKKNEQLYDERGSQADLGAYVAYTIAANELRDLIERIENDDVNV